MTIDDEEFESLIGEVGEILDAAKMTQRPEPDSGRMAVIEYRASLESTQPAPPNSQREIGCRPVSALPFNSDRERDEDPDQDPCAGSTRS